MEDEQMNLKFSLETKEAKSDNGIQRISGHASVFGNMDSHGDIILPGAFKSSIEKALDRKIKLFSSHSMDARDLIGTVVELREDGRGLFFEAEVSQAESSQDLATKAKEGHLDEVSIGFFLTDSEFVRDEDGQAIRMIKEVELIEISLVTRASNSEARVLEVKQENNNEHESEEEIKMEENKDIKSLEEKLASLEKKLEQPMRVPQVEEVKSVEMTNEEKQSIIEDLFYQKCTGKMSNREYARQIEEKALSSVIEEDGAATIPKRLHDELIKKLDRINRVEQDVRKLTGNGPLDILDYDFNPTWATHDDGDTISETSISSIFGKSNLDPQDYAALVTIPKRLERRSFMNIQSLLAEDFANAYKELKEDKIFQGSGNKEPLGIVTMLSALSANSESITALANLDLTAMVNCAYNLDEQYRINGKFYAHPDAIKQLRLLVDGSSRPLWQNEDVQGGRPATFYGWPVVETKALVDGNASGETPVVFGDLNKYIMLEEKSFSVEASDHANFNSNKSTLRMVVSFDGMPVDKNAFSKITIA